MSSSCFKVVWVPVEYLEYGEYLNVVLVSKFYGFPVEYLEYGEYLSLSRILHKYFDKRGGRER